MNLFVCKRTILVIDDLSSIIVSSVLQQAENMSEVITPVQSEISLGQSWIENMVGFHPFLPVAVGGLSVIVLRSSLTLSPPAWPVSAANAGRDLQVGSVTAPWSGFTSQQSFQVLWRMPRMVLCLPVVFCLALQTCSMHCNPIAPRKQQPFVYVFVQVSSF